MRRVAGEQPLLVEQHARGGGDIAPGGGDHVVDAEVDPPGTLAARGGHQADRGAVAGDAGHHPRLAQQPFEARRRRGVVPPGCPPRAVEVDAGRELEDDELVGRRAFGGGEVAHGEARGQGAPLVGQGHRQIVGHRCHGAADEAVGVERPPEGGAGVILERGQDAGDLGAVAAVGGASFEEALPLDVVAVQDGAGGVEGLRGDDEADRLDVAKPFEVGEDVWVRGHRWGLRRAYPRSGIR